MGAKKSQMIFENNEQMGFQRLQKLLPSQKSSLNIKYLELYNNNIGAKGVKHLARCGIINLTFLNIGKNNIGSEGVRYLQKMQLNGLDQLGLENHIHLEGIKFLAQTHLQNLRAIGLQENRMGSEGAKILIGWDFHRTTQLNIWNNNISGEFGKWLEKLRKKNKDEIKKDIMISI